MGGREGGRDGGRREGAYTNLLREPFGGVRFIRNLQQNTDRKTVRERLANRTKTVRK